MKTLIKTNELKTRENLKKLDSVINTWLDKTVSLDSDRSEDMRNDKRRAVEDFFIYCSKTPEHVLVEDVSHWRDSLREKNLADGTVYNRVSYLSSFYEFLRTNAELQKFLPINPARLALPKAPKAFVSESTKALDNEKVKSLLGFLKKLLPEDKDVYYRDYAILEMFIATGMRRNEILSLRGKDLEFTEEGRFLINTKIKGGNFVRREVADEIARDAVILYLRFTKRLKIIGKDEPLWIAFDRGRKTRDKGKAKPLKSHSFARRMKAYAKKAGIEDFHLHKLRHTYARMVADESESMADTQEALGHQNIQTTKKYVQRIGIKRDKFSKSIRERLNR